MCILFAALNDEMTVKGMKESIVTCLNLFVSFVNSARLYYKNNNVKKRDHKQGTAGLENQIALYRVVLPYLKSSLQEFYAVKYLPPDVGKIGLWQVVD
jgi:hypothetical protein